MPEQETPEARAEARAIRRRWITLGEVLAVAAVLISAGTLWNSWREREDEAAKQAGETRKSAVQAATLALGGAADADGAKLAISALRSDQVIQGQTIRFPGALAVAAVETTGDPRIEAGWIDRQLIKALAAAKANLDAPGDRRLPVLIVTRFWSDGAVRQASGYYDVGYTLSRGGLLDGRDVRFKGLSYIGPARPAGAADRLDALWRARIGSSGN